MLRKIAGFEFRYQLKNPVFWVAVIAFFLLSFGVVASESVSIGGTGGGNIHENGPFKIAMAMLLFSIFYLFVSTAFVANVIVRDDDTGFGPIVRSTRVTKFDYLFGRFLGAFAIAAFGFLAIPLGIWVGSLMPWVDQETLGPTRGLYYFWSYFVLAVPDIFVTGAIFFALATATRSMMTTYVGVIAFLILWGVMNSVLGNSPEYQHLVAITDAFGLGAYGEATRYWTASERNSLVPAFAGLLLVNRLVWMGVALLFLGLAYRFYRFSDKGISKRRLRRERAFEASTEEDAGTATILQPPLGPRHDGRSARALFATRTRFEMRQVFRSPAFFVLMALGLLNAGIGMWFGGRLFGTPTHPATFSLIPMLRGSFAFIPIIIAIYYSGELVWRERDRKMHEIIDATPMPNWAFAIPKTMAVAAVLISSLLISVVAAILIQLIKGEVHLELDKYLLWYVLPTGFDLILIAVLAVFVQSLSPHKYIGWGVMVLYIIATMVFQSVGLEHNLYLYGNSPQEPLSDMNGAGIYWIAGWWFRLYWGAVALILVVVSHLLWRRGTETRLMPRLRLAKSRLRGAPGAIALAALLVAGGTGAWIFYNTNILNEYRTRDDVEQFMAEYERRYLRFETLPQPTISHVALNVALYPDQIRADVTGSYRLTNLTGAPISQVHVRNPDRQLKLPSISRAPAWRRATRNMIIASTGSTGQWRPAKHETSPSARGASRSASATPAPTSGWCPTAPSSTISSWRPRSA
jgi:hypothetical protein